jgi:hypothetical protein
VGAIGAMAAGTGIGRTVFEPAAVGPEFATGGTTSGSDALGPSTSTGRWHTGHRPLTSVNHGSMHVFYKIGRKMSRQ